MYTDYGAAVSISTQTSISTSSTTKTNLRIVRASEFIQRFQNLEVRHKPGAAYIVPDALSRLQQEDAMRDYSERQT